MLQLNIHYQCGKEFSSTAHQNLRMYVALQKFVFELEPQILPLRGGFSLLSNILTDNYLRISHKVMENCLLVAANSVNFTSAESD